MGVFIICLFLEVCKNHDKYEVKRQTTKQSDLFFLCARRGQSQPDSNSLFVCTNFEFDMVDIDMVKTEDYDDLLQFFQVVNTHTHTKWNYQQHDSKLINSKLCWSPLVQMSFSNTALQISENRLYHLAHFVDLWEHWPSKRKTLSLRQTLRQLVSLMLNRFSVD